MSRESAAPCFMSLPLSGCDHLIAILVNQGRLTYTDALGHTTSYAYNQRGWVTQVTDPLNLLSTTTYDTEGNVLSVQDPRGNFTTFSYDPLNRLTQTQNALGGLATVLYDAAGNVVKRVNELGNATTFAYDALNRRTAVTDPLSHTVTTVYDAVGNVLRTIDAAGFTTTMSYDLANRRTTVQDPGGGVFTYVYDGIGEVVNTIDQVGDKSTFVYDTKGEMTRHIDPRGGVTTTTYDNVGNILSVRDSVGNITTFVYDAANRQTQMTDPFNNSSTYSYDLANRLTSTTDRDARRIDNTYDNDNRLTKANWVVSGSTVNTLTFSYDNNKNLLTAANYNGTYTMSYDALNRVTVTQEPFGLTLTATYDSVGNRTQLQDSFNGILTSVYDAANRLTSRQFGGASQTSLREDLTYTPRNQIATEIRYSDLNGNTKIGSTTFTYDPAARLTNLQHLNGSGSSLANYTYTYDLANRLTTEVLNGTTTTYQYDAANELTSDTAHSYSYDLNGNRTMTGYQTDKANELKNDGVWTYTYDAEGNLTKKSRGPSSDTWTYGYDNKNHMIWAKDAATDGGAATTLATYVYDALGNRIEKDVWTQQPGTTITTRFGYDGVEVWVDLTSANALQTRYMHGDAVDQLFARISSGGTAAWYLTDRLGSVRDIVNSSGSVIDHLDYDGFGNATETQPTNGDRYKWTGREFDTETSLQYNRARYYDPFSGRWLSMDPFGFRPGDANLYRYVMNTPVNASDPSGLWRLGIDLHIPWGGPLFMFGWTINMSVGTGGFGLSGGVGVGLGFGGTIYAGPGTKPPVGPGGSIGGAFPFLMFLTPPPWGFIGLGGWINPGWAPLTGPAAPAPPGTNFLGGGISYGIYGYVDIANWQII
jgi:RHS repeat-associated protein